MVAADCVRDRWAGTGAYRLAFKQPSRFAGLLIVAGRVVPGLEYGKELIDADQSTCPIRRSTNCCRRSSRLLG